MENMIQLFEEFILKTIVLTENFLNLDLNQDVNFEGFTNNRDRLLHIIDSISQQVNWEEVSAERRDEFNRQIDYIKKLDEKVITKLQEHQTDIKEEIERTVRQKDNIKGYNLNDVK
jgi:hypothetical protein